MCASVDDLIQDSEGKQTLREALAVGGGISTSGDKAFSAARVRVDGPASIADSSGYVDGIFGTWGEGSGSIGS